MVFLATPFFFSSSSFGNIFRGGGVETRAAKFVKIREEWYGISEERNGGVGIPRHWLFPLLNEIILSKICRVQRKMIFFVRLCETSERGFWKKIYLSIKIERLILFFFYIETELQIREDYGIFMGWLVQRNNNRCVKRGRKWHVRLPRDGHVERFLGHSGDR